MSWIELLATVTGLVCVILTIRENIWCWPFGLVQVTLFVYVFWDAKLYSDMVLHVIYIPMQFYGWYNWRYGATDRTELHVSIMPWLHRFFWLAVGTAGTAALGYGMSSRTDAALPYWDAATTVLSLEAQYLMTEKKVESFLLWIAVDVLCVGIYTVKGLYLTTGLYAVFLVLATVGFLSWRRAWIEQR